MALALYHNDMSSCAQKVRLCLAEKGLQWESRHLNLRGGEHQQDWYLKLNRRAVVPTLIDGDIVVPESNVINEYLDERFPEPPLKPADPFGRAKMRLWTKQPDEGVHDAGIAVLSFALAFRHQYISRGEAGKEMLESIPDPAKRERTVIGLSDLRVLEAEPPGVRTPGPWLLAPTVDPAQAGHYRELQPLLWALAIDGPRPTPLSEIAGTAAYRAIRCPSEEGLATPGVYASACDKLRRETVALRTIAGWPAMNVERAGRLLNALYLAGALLVSRTHPAARSATRTGWRLKR